MKHSKQQLTYTNDFVFKYILLEDKEICASLLTAIFQQPIHSSQITYAPTELYSRHARSKDIRLDLSLCLDHHQIINIEMQMVSSLKEIPARATYYACLAFTEQEESKNKNYAELYPVLQIFFINQILFKSSQPYLNRYALLELKRYELLSNKLEIEIIEIPKAIEQIKDKKLLSQWCYFLKHGHKKEDEIVKRLKVRYDEFRKAEEMMEKISLDKKLRDRAFARQKRIMDENQIRYEGRKEGEEIGLLKGEQRAKFEIAKQMLSADVPQEQIIQFTGLTAEEISRISN